MCGDALREQSHLVQLPHLQRAQASMRWTVGATDRRWNARRRINESKQVFRVRLLTQEVNTRCEQFHSFEALVGTRMHAYDVERCAVSGVMSQPRGLREKVRDAYAQHLHVTKDKRA